MLENPVCLLFNYHILQLGMRMIGWSLATTQHGMYIYLPSEQALKVRGTDKNTKNQGVGPRNCLQPEMNGFKKPLKETNPTSKTLIKRKAFLSAS